MDMGGGLFYIGKGIVGAGVLQVIQKLFFQTGKDGFVQGGHFYLFYEGMEKIMQEADILVQKLPCFFHRQADGGYLALCFGKKGGVIVFDKFDIAKECEAVTGGEGILGAVFADGINGNGA